MSTGHIDLESLWIGLEDLKFAEEGFSYFQERSDRVS